MRLKIFALILLSIAICFSSQSYADHVAPATVIEESKPLPPPVRSLGTVRYLVTNGEKPYFDRLPENERETGSVLNPYSLQNKAGKYVSWCGIVREINKDPKSSDTNLLVQMKYFDGTQDSHMMTVAWNGAGNFVAKLNAKNAVIPLLSLVRVYGKVAEYKENVPEIRAEYVRVWPWGLFNFMDLKGKAANDKWEKLCIVESKDIYDAFPNFRYYQDRLGAAPANQKFVSFAKPAQPESITDEQIQKSDKPLVQYVMRALERLKRHYLDGAIADTTKAIQIDLTCGPAYGLRAMARREKGEYDGALKDIENAIRLNAESDAGYYTRAQIYSCLGKHDLALKDFDRAIEMNSKDLHRYLFRAEEYEALGKYQKAVDDYNRFLQAEPRAKFVVEKRDKLLQKLQQKSK